MREQFKEVRFRDNALGIISICNEIIDEYLANGFKLTLRQLYYQLVTRNIITNEEKSYKNLSSLISSARLAGLVDWEAIEDRVRQPKIQSEFNNLSELIEAAINSYRLPRWDGQEYYAELWCFPPYTKVTIPNGVIAIGLLKIGDLVIDHKGTSKKNFKYI